MPRDLPLSNGRLLVNFDSAYALRDIYYPYVGKENHAYQCRSRLGLWVDGAFSWIHDPGWTRSLKYARDSLVTDFTAVNDELRIALTVEDCVDFDLDVLVRRFSVRNDAERSREVRLFVHVDVALGGNTVGDTAFFHPDYQALVAYKNVHYLLLSGRVTEGSGLDAWAAGHKDRGADEGSWRDAEDGALEGTPIAFGSVDFVGGLYLGAVAPGDSSVAHAWLVAGTSLSEVEGVHERVVEQGPEALLHRTRDYWRAWVAKEDGDHPGLRDLSAPVRTLYRRSLLVARAQIDNRGAIIASSDSDVSAPYQLDGAEAPMTDVFHGHEDYAYSWPRDGALVASAFVRAGYPDVSRLFLEFCARNMTHERERGHSYMLQKYMANDTVASNVIPWVNQRGERRLPIQEDETALVLIAFRDHYRKWRDWELQAPLYRPLVNGMANFLVDFRHPATGLPLASQELWEERRGVHAFTVATVWRALRDAAYFTELFNEPHLTDRYQAAAEEVKHGTEEHLYDQDSGRFARTVTFDDEGQPQRDMVVDASLWALPYFGMFAPDDPRVVRTMAAVESRLTVSGPHGGLARFEGDVYQLRESGAAAGVPGNPWFLCSLWLAQYQILAAKEEGDLAAPLRTLEAIAQAALPSGVLAEQIDPLTGEPAGATPLTWAHATVIQTVLEYIDARGRLDRKRPDQRSRR